MSEWEWAHAAIGSVASLIFILQTFGEAGGHDVDFNADVDIDAGTFAGAHDDGGLFHLLSVRNFVALFVGYGWVSLAALMSGASKVVSSLAGVCAGVALIFISLYLMKTFLRFQESGSLDMESLAGKHASVYIMIGASASSAGKVMVDTKDGRMELPARSNDPRVLHPGQLATIVKVDEGVLWVTAGE
jgi:hypothetical protein